MKLTCIRLVPLIAASLALAAFFPVASAWAVGGGDQVLIGSLPYVINDSGSYLLAGNLSSAGDGIIINANRVSIDLGGFSLNGRPGSRDGILARGSRNSIEIFNGTIAGWGGEGIQGDGSYTASYHDLRLSANGLCGLRAGHAAVISNVVAQNNGGTGIQGFEALVISDCSTAGNQGWGFELGTGSTIQACAALHNGGGGIFAESGALVRGNVSSDNGWAAGASGDAACGAGTLAGIAVLGTGARVDGNTVFDNAIGLQLLSAGSSVSDNLVSGNDVNFQFEPGNQLELLLSELPQTISWPAKVTLAGTLVGVSGQDGIRVDADGVTIDMLDHGLVGVPGSLSGIRVLPGRSTIHIMDGFVREWGSFGINTDAAFDCRLLEVSVEGNGLDGLRVGPGSAIEGCTASNNGSDGIKTDEDCVVTGCTSNGNDGDGVDLGLHSSIAWSTASENGTFGIRADRGSSVSHCTASKNTMGIAVARGCTVVNCTTSFNSQIGIRADGQCQLLSNLCDQSNWGIAVLEGSGTRVDGNNLSNNQIGLNIAAAGNLAVRNSSWANVLAYSIDPASSFGPIVDVSAGGVVGTDNPWANFRN